MSVGAVHCTVTRDGPAVAMTAVGALGAVAAWPAFGVTSFEGADAGPVPPALVAVTVKVYAVPLSRPVTMTVVPVDAAVRPEGDDVTRIADDHVRT